MRGITGDGRRGDVTGGGAGQVLDGGDWRLPHMPPASPVVPASRVCRVQDRIQVRASAFDRLTFPTKETAGREIPEIPRESGTEERAPSLPSQVSNRDTDAVATSPRNGRQLAPLSAP